MTLVAAPPFRRSFCDFTRDTEIDPDVPEKSAYNAFSQHLRVALVPRHFSQDPICGQQSWTELEASVAALTKSIDRLTQHGPETVEEFMALSSKQADEWMESPAGRQV